MTLSVLDEDYKNNIIQTSPNTKNLHTQDREHTLRLTFWSKVSGVRVAGALSSGLVTTLVLAPITLFLLTSLITGLFGMSVIHLHFSLHKNAKV